MAHFIPNVLSIAGVDPSGGAGILADIKTFTALGTYGCGIITALTAQNPQTVSAVHIPPISFLRQQFITLFEDIKIDAVKIGMLADEQIILEVAHQLKNQQIAKVICDPVMVAQSGAELMSKHTKNLLKEVLFPLVSMITPNLPEAAVLTENRPPENKKEMYRCTEQLHRLLPDDKRWILLKGGHLPGNMAIDLLFNGDQMQEFSHEKINTHKTHGTGCTLSSAICAKLAPLIITSANISYAVKEARNYVIHALSHAHSLNVGSHYGPLNHLYSIAHSLEK